MARSKNEITDFNIEQPRTVLDKASKKPPRLMKATDFLKGDYKVEPDEAIFYPAETKADESEQLNSVDEPQEWQHEADYHVRAGRIGGQTTKQRHRDSNFYKEIGARGGTTTMARHGAAYSERRKKAAKPLANATARNITTTSRQRRPVLNKMLPVCATKL